MAAGAKGLWAAGAGGIWLKLIFSSGPTRATWARRSIPREPLAYPGVSEAPEAVCTAAAQLITRPCL